MHPIGDSIKIRAAILEEIEREPPYATTRPLTIDEVELALPGRGEVLVKIQGCMIERNAAVDLDQ